MRKVEIIRKGSHIDWAVARLDISENAVRLYMYLAGMPDWKVLDLDELPVNNNNNLFAELIEEDLILFREGRLYVGSTKIKASQYLF